MSPAVDDRDKLMALAERCDEKALELAPAGRIPLPRVMDAANVLFGIAGELRALASRDDA